MVSLLFAGIKISTLRVVQLMPKLLTQGGLFSVGKWPIFDWNSGRLQIGMVAGFTSESAVNQDETRAGV